MEYRCRAYVVSIMNENSDNRVWRKFPRCHSTYDLGDAVMPASDGQGAWTARATDRILYPESDQLFVAHLANGAGLIG